MERHDVTIVGAGLAGLCCAARLRQDGLEPLVLAREPAGRSLVSVTRPDLDSGPEVRPAVRRQPHGWFGGVVEAWRHLRSYEIPRALPWCADLSTEPAPGIPVCGDHAGPASIQAAMQSGRETAERLMPARA